MFIKSYLLPDITDMTLCILYIYIYICTHTHYATVDFISFTYYTVVLFYLKVLIVKVLFMSGKLADGIKNLITAKSWGRRCRQYTNHRGEATVLISETPTPKGSIIDVSLSTLPQASGRKRQDVRSADKRNRPTPGRDPPPPVTLT